MPGGLLFMVAQHGGQDKEGRRKRLFLQVADDTRG